jgi:hypothetical protein
MATRLFHLGVEGVSKRLSTLLVHVSLLLSVCGLAPLRSQILVDTFAGGVIRSGVLFPNFPETREIGWAKY